MMPSCCCFTAVLLPLDGGASASADAIMNLEMSTPLTPATAIPLTMVAPCDCKTSVAEAAAAVAILGLVE